MINHPPIAEKYIKKEKKDKNKNIQTNHYRPFEDHLSVFWLAPLKPDLRRGPGELSLKVAKEPVMGLTCLIGNERQ